VCIKGRRGGGGERKGKGGEVQGDCMYEGG